MHIKNYKMTKCLYSISVILIVYICIYLVFEYIYFSSLTFISNRWQKARTFHTLEFHECGIIRNLNGMVDEPKYLLNIFCANDA